MDWLLGLIQAVKDIGPTIANFVGLGVNSKNQQDTNAQNAQINQNQLDYNAAMTREQWERDDNAHQREVADLQAAGLSPIASLNGAQTSGALGAPSPIAMEAPQLDFNALAQSMLGAQALQEQKREFDVTSGQKDTELENNAKKITAEIEHMKNIDENTKTQLLQASKSLELKAKEIQLTFDQLSENKRQFDRKQALEENKEAYKQLAERTQKIFDRLPPEVKKYYGQGVRGYKSLDDLRYAQEEMDAMFQQMCKELGALGNQDNTLEASTSLNGELKVPFVAEVDGDLQIQGKTNYKLEDKRKAIIAKYSSKMYYPVLMNPSEYDLYDSNGFVKSAKVN